MLYKANQIKLYILTDYFNIPSAFTDRSGYLWSLLCLQSNFSKFYLISKQILCFLQKFRPFYQKLISLSQPYHYCLCRSFVHKAFINWFGIIKIYKNPSLKNMKSSLFKSRFFNASVRSYWKTLIQKLCT